jgi:hypothetical protein
MQNQFNFEISPFAIGGRNEPDDGDQNIRQLQQALNRTLGLQLPLDGAVSFRTRRAIRDFQRRKGLPADGIVGPATEKELMATSEREIFGNERESESALEDFIGTEHRDIGDLAVGQQPTTIAYGETGQRLSFGEVIALAGDYFGTYEEMRDLARTREGRSKIAWARWKALDLPKNAEPNVANKIKDSVRERYYVLASNNVSHFSAGGTAWNTYVSWHSKAIADAFRAGEEGSEAQWRQALTKEAFGNHFLTDSFSAGHVRTPRAELRAWYGQNFPGSTERFIRYMAKFMYDNLNKRQRIPPLAWWLSWMTKSAIGQRIKKLGGEAVRSFSLGDIVSLALHDLDNRGLKVVSAVNPYGNKIQGGYRWVAVGDSHLRTMKGAATKLMVVNAVKSSLKELERVRDAGRAAKGRKLSGSQRSDTVKKAIGGPFAAGAFVPKEDRTAGANIPLPGTGGTSPLEWHWGRLGSVAYHEVNITVKKSIADELFSRMRDIPDIVKQSGVQVHGIHEAFRAFIEHLRAKGIGVLEAAVEKKARRTNQTAG